MQGSAPLKNSTLALLIGLISLVVFAESSIPYIYAQHKTPVGSKFLGQIIYMPDQDMYFSFIREARDGKFVFNNRLTYLPNKPAFINLEFWFVGALQQITGLSEDGIYQVWRYLGILLLTIGVTLTARVVLPTGRQVIACVVMLLFTGGFGFVFALLSSAHLISIDAMHNGILDMRFGFLPFQQVTTNPHFSFPHGLILIAYAFFLMGEQRGISRYYFLSGLFFAIIGFVRPYDIILPFAILPLYVLITGGLRTGASLAIKALPLLMILPVLAYNVWLFRFSDAFKEWSTQGLNSGSLPSALWHYLAYGIVGILAIIRVAQYRTNPLSKNDKFLITWFLLTFMLIQAGRYLPIIGWSPQIGVYLAVPLALLACSVRLMQASRLRYYAAIAVIAVCILAGNISIVAYYAKNFSDSSKIPLFYAGNNEVAAWQWLNANVKEGNVVLAMPSTSLQIGKYTSASVVAAHYSVTPHYIETANAITGIYANATLGLAQQSALQKLHVDYVYIGPAERMLNSIKAEPGTCLTSVYSNPDVTIYKVNNRH